MYFSRGLPLEIIFVFMDEQKVYDLLGKSNNIDVG